MGETRRRVIPLSVFMLSLNSRPATEANGVLIYSCMTPTHTHTHTHLIFSNRQATSLCHMCFYNTLSLSLSLSRSHTLYVMTLESMEVRLFTLHSSGRWFFQSNLALFFHPHRKLFGVQQASSSRILVTHEQREKSDYRPNFLKQFSLSHLSRFFLSFFHLLIVCGH